MLRAAALLAALGACAAPMPGGAAGGCGIAGSSDWAAWISAMPGPGRQPSLIVTGRVTVPTGGYRLSLRQGPLQESDPPTQQVLLDVSPPAGGATQAVVTHEVRGDWPALDRYRAVTILCGGEILADISPVERAV